MVESATPRVWLLVEDDTLIRMMLSTLISTWDIKPLAFEDGNTTMAWLDEVEGGKATLPLPELALLDIRLPGPPGTEIAKRLRKISATSNIAIVLMTAYRFDPNERTLVDSEVRPDQFISKPLPPPAKLRELLDTALESRRGKKTGPLTLPKAPTVKEPTAQKPAEPPAAQPAQAAEQKPAEGVTEKPAPAPKAAEGAKGAEQKPAESTAGRPTRGPVTKPLDGMPPKPELKPADEPVDKPAKETPPSAAER